MVSTPLWIQKDFGILLTPNSFDELGNDSAPHSSSLQSTQVLQLDFEKLANEVTAIQVSAKQIRFQSRAYVDHGFLAKISPVKAHSKSSGRDRKSNQNSERWWLSGIDRNPGRSPATQQEQEEIKILSFDEDDYLSEYLELNEGVNEFELHYISSNSQKKSKILKVFLK